MAESSRGLVVLTQNLWFNTSRDEKWDALVKTEAVDCAQNAEKIPSSWKARCFSFQRWLGLLSPDVICLQEVLMGNGIDMLSDIFDGCPDLAVYSHRAFCHASPWWKDSAVSFGNAIVSKFPIQKSFEIQLPAHPHKSNSLGSSKETRSALNCLIAHPILGTISVTTTHFNWKLHHSSVRLEQAAVLSAFVRANYVPGFPAIITGDFNAVPNEACIRYLTGELVYEGRNINADQKRGSLAEEYPALTLRKSVYFVDSWKRAGRPNGSDGATWSNYNINTNVHLDESKRLDYIFVAPPNENGVGLVEECRVVCDHIYSPNGAFPSDHFGVLAELRIIPSVQISRAKF